MTAVVDVVPETARRIDLETAFENANTRLCLAIGVVAGTRTVSGAKTARYYGQPVPGDYMDTYGTFARPGESPESADRLWLSALNGSKPAFERAILEAGLDCHDALQVFAYFDLATQYPAAAAAYLKRLSRKTQWENPLDELAQLRAEAIREAGYPLPRLLSIQALVGAQRQRLVDGLACL